MNIDEPLISIPATTGDAFPPFGKVGWYKGARVPGFPGSAHILGHIDTKTAYQPFWALQFVHLCDKVEVWLSNGQKETDVITGIKHEPKDAVKNDDSVWTTDQRHLLQLFTCWPHNFNHATGHYPEQLIIYTEEVSITG